MKYVNDRITIDEKICNGKPIIRGKRITVQTILEFLTAGDSREDILYQYPSLEKEDITACMQFAVDLMKRNYIVKRFTYA
jgi:uncharacterized protein (DUF433 family)